MSSRDRGHDMLYLQDGLWHCDCGRKLREGDLAAGQCSTCRQAGAPAPSPRAIELVRAGRILDMRDERWQTACPR